MHSLVSDSGYVTVVWRHCKFVTVVMRMRVLFGPWLETAGNISTSTNTKEGLETSNGVGGMILKLQ
jgi:hypothetical protein